jgi:L,D-transpeptidase ErfK/SrfK
MWKHFRTVFILLLIASFMNTAAKASQLQLADKVSGSRSRYVVQQGDTFASLGARYGISPSVLADANGYTTRERPLVGSAIWADNRHIVPLDMRDAIVINVPQRMLFLFKDDKLWAAYPVAPGQPSRQTPLGDFTIKQMQRDPTWRVPVSIQEEMAQRGKVVRTSVPPGPDNPLGRYWIGLNRDEIGIHATTSPNSIYRLRSHGCIRLNPEDAAELFPFVTVGMPVRIIYEPVLLARSNDGRIFLEVNPDRYRIVANNLEQLYALASSHHLSNSINWQRVREVIQGEHGIARDVTRDGGRQHGLLLPDSTHEEQASIPPPGPPSTN